MEGKYRVLAMPEPELTAWSDRLRQIAHDGSNALVPLYATIDLVQMDCADTCKRVSDLSARIEMLRALLHKVGAAARRPQLDVGGSLHAAHAALTDQALSQRVALRWGAPVLAETIGELPESDVAHIVTLLVNNSLEAHRSDPGERARWIEVDFAGTEASIRLRVCDNGPGCPDVAAAAAGQRRRHGLGHLGLGLHFAASILATVGAELTIANGSDGGFVAEVTLDASAA